MKKSLILILLVTIASFYSISQSNTNTWYFGDGNILDFTGGGDPIISERGVEIATDTSTFCREGTSAINNSSDEILFYTDGVTVWDRLDGEMPNGSGLIGGSSTAQILVVPNPYDSAIYYVFHTDFGGASGFHYSEIDMTLNSGLGDVTDLKNVALTDEACTEQMKAITHCNGKDIWVISHDHMGTNFNVFLIDEDGVSSDPVVTSIGTGFTGGVSGMCFMACTKDGSKIATTNSGSLTIDLIDFNNETGTLSSPVTIPSTDDWIIYGCEFSEDGSKLYVTGYGLYQYNLDTDDWYTYPVAEPAGILRGPNDKIYVASGCDYYSEFEEELYEIRVLHIIHSPNEAGAPSDFELDAYTTPRECGLGLGNYYVPTIAPSTITIAALGGDICVGECINYVNESEGDGSFSWEFEGGSPESFEGYIPPEVCYDEPGVFNTILRYIKCGEVVDSVIVEVNVTTCSGVDFESTEQIICEENCIDFTDLSTVESPTSWSWFFEGGVPSISTAENPVMICYPEAGIFDVTLTITDEWGEEFTFTSEDYITTTICAPPIADFEYADTICQNSCIDFTDLSLNDPTTWYWTFDGAETIESSEMNPTNICFNTAGVFDIVLHVTNAYGIDEVTKQIVVMDNPYAGENLESSHCLTAEGIYLDDFLSPESDTGGDWMSDDLGTITGGWLENDLFNLNGMTLSYIVTNPLFESCQDTASLQLDFNTVPTIELGDNFTWCSNTPLTVVGTSNEEITWFDGSNGATYDYFPNNTDDNTELLITANVSNECGEQSDNLTVTFENCDLYVYIPNAFTPGTGNLNDEFQPSIIGNSIHDFKLTIYNRWGNVLFVSYNVNDCAWDGSLDGNLVQSGIYIWKLEFDYEMNGLKNYAKTGHITVLR